MKLTDKEFDELMKEARTTNDERDEDERSMGLAAPPDCELIEYFETAIVAIEAGIRADDKNATAEGLAMLQSMRIFIPKRKK